MRLDDRNPLVDPPLSAELAERLDDCEAVITTVEAELTEDHFAAGFGKFREALNLSRGFPSLEQRVSSFAVEQAKRWLPENWRFARSLLLEVSEANVQLAAPVDLLETIQQHEQESSIAIALKAADEASSNGLTTLAVRRLTSLGTRYPNDRRIQNQLQALEVHRKSQSQCEKLNKEKTQYAAVEEKGLLARATWARAREFEKAGFAAEALEQWRALESLDPLYPGLKEELERQRVPRHLAVRPVLPEFNAQPLASERLKTASTAALAGAAMTALILVVWAHLPHKPAGLQDTRSTQSPVMAKPISPDDQAWAAVDRSNVDSIEAYLNRFPAGTNRPQAVQAMVDYRRNRVLQQESAEVLEAVRQYSSAWSNRDAKAILALQTYLDPQQVATRLRSLQSLAILISPLSQPVIAGDIATLRCLQRTSEVSRDGLTKRTPDQALTFHLAKRNGSWLISSID